MGTDALRASPCQTMAMPRLALSLALALACFGQTEEELTARMLQFRLYNACRPMQLDIQPLADDAAAIGLTKEDLQAAAESRLRAARLYTENIPESGGATFSVSVNVVGLAFSLNVEYHKWVTDEFNRLGTAITWIGGSTGQHGNRNKSFVLSSLSQHLDKFLATYLRVNEAACGDSAGQP